MVFIIMMMFFGCLRSRLTVSLLSGAKHTDFRGICKPKMRIRAIFYEFGRISVLIGGDCSGEVGVGSSLVSFGRTVDHT